ncbi:MAG: methionine biosynthesis protein MetW [Vicinamibacteria bacterium]|nr:methionine biosynthesis protein MetW [Vicinamibacteria bacterium]
MRKLLATVDGRIDLTAIAEWITEDGNVLDLGCGDGALLDHLIRHKRIRGMGVDIDFKRLLSCVRRGIPVVQKDLNQPLGCFGDGSYDHVILSQTIQQVSRPEDLMMEILRIGRNAIVSFPNFGHYSLRLQLLLSGRMPRTRALPYEWHRTPNIHLMTLADFEAFCHERHVRILRRAYILRRRLRRRVVFANLLSEGAVVLASRDRS